MARLNHPNSIHVFHVDQDHDGRPYFTMQLIDGGSLDRRLDEFRQSPREAAKLLVKVARAVQHAHERGILHRDLKPANILLDREEPVVTDYGLAKQVGTGDGQIAMAATLEGVSRVVKGVFGTIPYMSPEQATPGEEVTTRSDVYGLGAILYALLTGKPPFRAETSEATLKQVQDPKTSPTPPRKLNPRVSRDLEAICLKCLDKDPTRRYRSAEGLAKDLECCLEGRETTARPWSSLGRVLGACRRSPVTMALTAAAVVLLLVTAVTVTSAAQGHKDRLEAAHRSLARSHRSRTASWWTRMERSWPSGRRDRS
jgi:serine/threonine-protein kinase